jgi:hypothetical protein
MIQPSQTSNLPTLSPEVRAFAREAGAEAYLLCVVEMTQRIFPDAWRLAVVVEEDPEIANDRHIVLEVDVPDRSPEQFVPSLLPWDEEMMRICPATLDHVFRLHLGLVEL